MQNEEWERIYIEEIKRNFFNAGESADKPIAYITGGQSGSGKSGIKEDVKATDTRKFVLIDIDELRSYHPDHVRLQQSNDRDAANHTHSDAKAWSKQLLSDAIAEKKNIFLDQTSKNPDNLKNLVARLKQNGYEVDIRLMAVPFEVSKERVEKRYLNEKEQDGYGRDCNIDLQKQSYHGVGESYHFLKKHIANTSTGKNLLVDRLSIYGENGDKLAEINANQAIEQSKLDQMDSLFVRKRLGDEAARKILSQVFLNTSLQDLPDLPEKYPALKEATAYIQSALSDTAKQANQSHYGGAYQARASFRQYLQAV